MSRDEAALVRTRKEIEAELEALQRLVEEYHQMPAGEARHLLRARASIFHDFYTAVERVFARIARELDGGLPAGEQWHRDLLLDMTLVLDEIRPAVISAEPRSSLGAFLSFRHLFRNVYGFNLDPDRLGTLAALFERTAARFRAEMTAFLDWLAGR